MRVLLLISFATLALSQGGSTCARYTCATSDHSLGTGDCATGVSMGTYDQFYVKPCPSGSMCPDTTILSTQSCSVTNLNSYAGAKCPTGTTCSLDASTSTPTHCVKGVC